MCAGDADVCLKMLAPLLESQLNNITIDTINICDMRNGNMLFLQQSN